MKILRLYVFVYLALFTFSSFLINAQEFPTEIPWFCNQVDIDLGTYLTNANIGDMYSWSFDYDGDGEFDLLAPEVSLPDWSFDTEGLSYFDEVEISLQIRSADGSKCDYPSTIKMEAKRCPWEVLTPN